jgi:hypothetical protein
MSEIHNTFIISGDNNTVSIDQDFNEGNNEALALVLKFLVTILLSPVLIPMILAMNGYKMVSGNGQGMLEDSDYGNE